MLGTKMVCQKFTHDDNVFATMITIVMCLYVRGLIQMIPTCEYNFHRIKKKELLSLQRDLRNWLISKGKKNSFKRVDTMIQSES